MKFLTTKTKTILLAAFVFLISTAPSYAALQDPTDDGPDGPPAAPIDDCIIPMMLVAIGIACIYFYKSTKNSAAVITKL